jgi:hypothetical protein
MEGQETDMALIDDLVRSYESETEGALARAYKAEADRDYWRSQFEDVRKRQADGTVGSNPVVEFSGQIAAEIKARGDVEGAVNRYYALGRMFLASVDQHGERYRQKVLRSCADVVNGAPSLLRNCDDHPLRSGEGANDPVVTRSSDGAVARRCYIESNTAAARRLHYWLLPDNSVEFASVNVHDDMEIPE